MPDKILAESAYPSSDEGASLSAPASSGVYAKTVKGSVWQFINAGGQKILQIGIFFVLARLLSPTDYGALSVIFIVNGFFNQLTDVPLGTALIQRQGDVEKYLDAYWTLDILRSALNAILIAVLGGLIAHWFGIVSSVNVIRLCGILLLIPTFSNVRTILIFKKMDFRIIAVRDLLTQTVFGVVAIGYAFLVAKSVAALLAGYIAMYVTGVVLSYILIPGRPRFAFSFRPLLELVPKAKWLYGQDLVTYGAQFADKILLGLMLTPTDLGFYSKAKDLSTSPAGFIVSMARSVGISAFALVQDNRVKIREGILQSIDILFLTAIPAAFVFMLEGGTIVRILLGSAWLPIVVPFKIIAFGSVFFACIHIMNTTVIGVGRPDVGFKANLIQTIIAIPLGILGVKLAGVSGLAYSTVLVWIGLTSYLFVAVRHTVQVSRFDVLRYAVIGLVTASVLVTLDLTIGRLIQASGTVLYDGLWAVSLGFIYFGVLYLIGRLWSRNPWKTGMAFLQHVRK
ncbi:MAG: oligosaccharide flippase family protein [Patescibacteria group bacterium]